MGLFDWLFKKPARGQAPADWKVSDRVLARWHDGFFYPGRVRSISGDQCEIAFDDGDVAWVSAAEAVSPELTPGSRVFARWRGGPEFLPGTVNERKGETVQVRYDLGEEEWTSLSMIRVNRGSSPAPPPLPPEQLVKPAVELGDAIEETDWRVGDRVLARWMDLFWYPGTILGMGTKGYHILFDDGDQRVLPWPGLMPLAIEEGEQVFIRPKNEPQRLYSPATVVRVQGESIDVEYEDGRRETNTRITRARLWRCPVGVSSLPFDEGDRVLAVDVDDFIYPAEIVSIQDDRVIVQFLDGPERMLTPELIRKFDLRALMKVECRWKGGPNYFPGTLAELDGERALVHYDDGDKEWTSIRLVRLKKEE